MDGPSFFNYSSTDGDLGFSPLHKAAMTVFVCIFLCMYVNISVGTISGIRISGSKGMHI